MIRPLIALCAVALLAGCGSKSDEQGAVTGEILPGSASDAMLPEDRLTSQPPLDPTAVRGTQKDAAPEATGKAEAAAPATEPAAEASAAAD